MVTVNKYKVNKTGSHSLFHTQESGLDYSLFHTQESGLDYSLRICGIYKIQDSVLCDANKRAGKKRIFQAADFVIS